LNMLHVVLANGMKLVKEASSLAILVTETRQAMRIHDQLLLMHPNMSIEQAAKAEGLRVSLNPLRFGTLGEEPRRG